MNCKTAILGNAFYSLNFDEVVFLENALICMDDEGYIISVIQQEDEQYREFCEQFKKEGKLKLLKTEEYILPGFIDLHIHAPQWPQSGVALDKPLERWLQDYTFPLESKYEDSEFAKEVYDELVLGTLRHGTTSALYFATVHLQSSLELAKICLKKGQRGFVGKVVMDDMVQNPENYRDASTEAALEDTEKFIREILKIQNDAPQKVYPVVTPRFVPSCTDEALEGLAKLAQKYDLHIQTHCSESDWQHQFSKNRFKMNDAQALDKFGLITDKTVLAHSVFLEDEDVELFARKHTSLAHCALSNVYFAGAVMPVKKFHEQGVNVGCGTDISGGYAPSMYHAIRQAVISSRMLETGVNPALSKESRGIENSAITLNNAFYLATVSGGKALKLPLGKFEKGYIADFQVLNTKGLPLFLNEKLKLTPTDILHKLLLLSESSNITQVWVQGNRVL